MWLFHRDGISYVFLYSFLNVSLPSERKIAFDTCLSVYLFISLFIYLFIILKLIVEILDLVRY